MGLQRWWKNKREHWRFRYLPPMVDALIGLTTYTARKSIDETPLRILVDSNVLGNAVTHETAWVSTGPGKWGDIEIETGYSARIPVHPEDSQSREYVNASYLPGVARLAHDGYLELLTSAELQDEIFRQPAGRFGGYGSFDYSILRSTKFESVDGVVFPTLGPSSLNLPSAKEQQLERIRNKADGLYLDLVKVLGTKSSLDAWHIRTAEKHGLFCFLTMDFKLCRKVRESQDREPIKSLKTKVMSPQELGEFLGLRPIPLNLLSYHGASWFVRPDLHMPGGKRRPLREYRRDSET
ncbi:MAG: hypothetical protein H6873_01145 [Hyphomicrobiaceae bacterium]|nr:hypothetical protein [Hyphomicrobiaceae bacterium]